MISPFGTAAMALLYLDVRDYKVQESENSCLPRRPKGVRAKKRIHEEARKIVKQTWMIAQLKALWNQDTF